MTVIVDAENRHVVIHIAVGSLEGAELRRGPEIGALVELVFGSADDVAGAERREPRGVVGGLIVAGRVLKMRVVAIKVIPVGSVGQRFADVRFLAEAHAASQKREGCRICGTVALNIAPDALEGGVVQRVLAAHSNSLSQEREIGGCDDTSPYGLLYHLAQNGNFPVVRFSHLSLEN